MKEQTEFYQTLFKSEGYNENEANELLNKVDSKLTEEEKQLCDQEVSEDEIFKVLKLMKLNKSPGDDVILAEFYIEYWYLIKPEFMKIVMYSFDNNTLAPSQYRAILTLLYKKGERENIANGRPISFLNIDYKIIDKVLAERLKIFFT